MDSENALALAALVVAFVALINTLIQVLQQYLATADGYRRCSPSVLGSWALFTKRQFKFKELRFETLFATPSIYLDVAYELNRLPSGRSTVILDGTEEMSKWPGLSSGALTSHHPAAASWSVYGHRDGHIARFNPPEAAPSASPSQFELLRSNSRNLLSRKLTARTQSRVDEFIRMDGDPDGTPENEPVSWIPFMRSLQCYSASLRRCGLDVPQDVGTGSLRIGRVMLPAVRLSKKSWDFMPPEMTKPYAVSNLRDIAVMVQSMGMHWVTFRPDQGQFRAEGDGSVITSAEVRSLGTVITYIKTDNRIDNRRELHGVVFSPLEGAAALGFGIINGDFPSGESYTVYSAEDCSELLLHLCKSPTEFSKLPRAAVETLITDIVGILTPVLRPVNTGITYVVKPSVYVTERVVSLRGSMHYFAAKLDKLLQKRSPKDQTAFKSSYHILQQCNSVLEMREWNPRIGRPITAYGGYEDKNVLSLLNDLHDAWRRNHDWLGPHRQTCRLLLDSHIAAMLESIHELDRIHRTLPLRYPENEERARAQLMDIYFEKCLPRCIKDLHASLSITPLLVEEIWIAVMYRALCWHAIHNFDEKVVAVPPRYHDSNLPIYIA